jgi:biopolymer transport protein TolQ
VNSSRHSIGSMERIFESGFREFVKLQEAGRAAPVMMDGTRRAMRATYQREMDHLEAHLSFLATSAR